jgi:hypothetical protein
MIKQYELFYHPDNGLVANAQDVKTYVKAVFGARSKEYKRVSKITFTRR